MKQNMLRLIGSITVLTLCILISAASYKVHAEEVTAGALETGGEAYTTEQSEPEESTTAPETTTTVPETTPEATSTPTDDKPSAGKKENGKWVKSKKGYKYRYSNGKYAGYGIITVKKSKYFINKKGYRTKGIITYKGVKYYFSKKSGKMYTGKKIITYKKNKYYVVKGKVAVGLKKIKKKYYYFSKKTGKMKKNKLIKVKNTYYYFGKSGKGVKKTAAQAYAIKLIERLCSKKDSSQEKLRKGFLYMVRNYYYAIKPGFVAPASSTWVESFAYNIYTTHSGRCYSFAAAFGVYAREVGYTAKVINASTHGINGGYVPHAWVEVIQGGYTYIYDPELAYQTGNVSSYYKRTYASTGARYRK